MTEADKEQDHRLARLVADGGRFGDKLRTLVLELWQRTRLDWGFVSDRLSTTFRRERSLGSSERRFVAETLYGMVRHLRRIDAAIAAGARRTASPRDEQRLLAYLVLEDGLDAKRAARLALACSLPDWLAERLVAVRSAH